MVCSEPSMFASDGTRVEELNFFIQVFEFAPDTTVVSGRGLVRLLLLERHCVRFARRLVDVVFTVPVSKSDRANSSQGEVAPSMGQGSLVIAVQSSCD